MKVKPFEIPEEEKPAIKKKLLAGANITICGCWEWKKIREDFGNGYGMICLPGKKNNSWVHRVSYAVFVGPIKEDHVVDHRCRNRRCINPGHLIQRTHQENCKAIFRRKIRDIQHSLLDLDFTKPIFGLRNES